MESVMIKCLDHGFVRHVDHMGSDLSVVRAARVSYNAEPRNDGSDQKLIDYLWRNEHTSPFEAVTFTFEVKAPIFVLRQWHRHRTQSYNEQSARYSVLASEYYVPKPEHITTQSKSNKQMRTDEQHPHAEMISKDIDAVCDAAFAIYNSFGQLETPRELARGILPVNTYSHMFVTMNLLNLFRFLRLRLHPHAQYEIRVYAEAILQIIEPIVPDSVEAFKKGNKAERALKTIIEGMNMSIAEGINNSALSAMVLKIKQIAEEGL